MSTGRVKAAFLAYTTAVRDRSNDQMDLFLFFMSLMMTKIETLDSVIEERMTSVFSQLTQSEKDWRETAEEARKEAWIMKNRCFALREEYKEFKQKTMNEKAIEKMHKKMRKPKKKINKGEKNVQTEIRL